MDAAAQGADLLHTTDKMVGHFRRGILSEREVINKLTEELAYHRCIDLTEAVLQRLPAELVRELRVWVGEVLRPEYSYQLFMVGKWPSEEHRQAYIRQMQAELIALASKLRPLLAASGGSGLGEA